MWIGAFRKWAQKGTPFQIWSNDYLEMDKQFFPHPKRLAPLCVFNRCIGLYLIRANGNKSHVKHNFWPHLTSYCVIYYHLWKIFFIDSSNSVYIHTFNRLIKPTVLEILLLRKFEIFIVNSTVAYIFSRSNTFAMVNYINTIKATLLI